LDTSIDTTKAFSLDMLTNYTVKTRGKNNGGVSAYGTAITFKTTASTGGNGDTVKLQLNDGTVDTIKINNIVLDSGLIITKPIRCYSMFFINTDSMTINKPIYVRDSLIYAINCKVGALSGSKIIPFIYPSNILTIKLNGKQGTIPVLPKGSVNYKTYIKWK
jgi:hypothetical protein